MLSEGEKSVYKALYINKEGLHVREICRLAKLSLPAVSKHIIKGEKEGIIFCKEIGRLKLCRLNFKSEKIVSILHEVELDRFRKLPHAAQESFNSFIDDLKEKPLIAIIFGSFASGKQTKKSDLDVLLVFQRADSRLMKNTEASARKISGRTGINIQPVSLSYEEFEKNILNKENEFMKDIKKNSFALRGLDIYLKIIGRFFE